MSNALDLDFEHIGVTMMCVYFFLSMNYFSTRNKTKISKIYVHDPIVHQCLKLKYL